MGFCLVLLVLSTSLSASGQTNNDSPARTQPSSVTVTASSFAEAVRLIGPGNVTHMRLEVYSPGGEKVFDSGTRDGNVLDWRWRDENAKPLDTDRYLCVVTVQSLSGKMSRKLAHVSFENQQATLRPVDVTQINPAQAQSSAASNADTPLTIVSADQGIAATVIAHDGADGQLSRTRGALTFHLGDFFSGDDKEQMRLTEDGRLGIGTANPQAKLDIAGTIRASKGVEFADGTVQTTGLSGRIDKDGNIVPAAAGSGTQGRIAKWSDDVGTLGDSTIFQDASNNLGIGTTSPNPNAVLHLHKAQSTGTAMFVTNDGGGTALSSLRAGLNPANYAVDYASLNILGLGWPSGAGGPFLKGKTVLIEGSGSNFGIGNINDTEPLLFYTTSSRIERMRLTASGNFGIGTANPAFKLDVAGDVNTSTQYNVGGSRVLGTPGLNTFVGNGTGINNSGNNNSNSFLGNLAGNQNTTGSLNSFFGVDAGRLNVTGTENAFFGYSAGRSNTVSFNSFFGSRAGGLNTTGSGNSFFGSKSGAANTSGSNNAFFGTEAGAANMTSAGNSFFGYRAGFVNTAGGNSFFGNFAGASNTTAANNSFFGNNAGIVNQTGANNSFFGGNAGSSNTNGTANAFFGYNAGSANISGLNNTFVGNQTGLVNTASYNTFVGNQAGSATTTGGFNTFFGTFSGNTNTTGNNNTIIGHNADVGTNNLTYATAIGAGTVVTSSNTIMLGRSNGTDTVVIPGSLFLPTGVTGTLHADDLVIAGFGAFQQGIQLPYLGNSGDQDICRNTTTTYISVCSSSLRYKTKVQTFFGGLNIVRRLRPITFNWKDGGMFDLGFAAEEVNEIEPLLTTYNDKGEIEGVKYRQITTVLVNAVNEQQQQIAEQQRIIEAQQQQLQKQLDLLQALKRTVCRRNGKAAVCK